MSFFLFFSLSDWNCSGFSWKILSRVCLFCLTKALSLARLLIQGYSILNLSRSLSLSHTPDNTWFFFGFRSWNISFGILWMSHHTFGITIMPPGAKSIKVLASRFLVRKAVVTWCELFLLLLLLPFRRLIVSQ